jgi:MFS family permease
MASTTEEDTGLAAVPWGSSELYVILSASMMGVMGVPLISPVLPELQSVFGVSDGQVGLVLTAYTLPGIVLTPLIGAAADRFGRRRVLIPLLFVFGIAGASISLARTFTEVLVLRFIQGVGATALTTLAVTLIGDFYDGNRQNAVMGFNGSMMGTSGALYPVIGGGLAGIRWNAPFLFFGVGIIVGVVAVVGLSEPAKQESSGIVEYLGSIREVALLPEALAIFAAVFSVFFMFFGAIQTALPLLISDEFGLPSSQIGILLSMLALASASVSILYGRISAWRSGPELVALGFFSYGISLLGIWLAPSPVFIGFSLLFFGVGFGLLIPAIDTTIVAIASSDLRAGMMGMRTSMIRSGQTAGPVAFTYLADTIFVDASTGYRALILVFGLGALFVGGGSYLYFRS